MIIYTSSIEVSDEDLAIVAHLIIDPERWFQHAMDTHGPEAVKGKIKTHRESYFADKEKYGIDYKNRAEREAIKQAIAKAAELESVEKHKAEQTEKDKAFREAVAKEVAKQLAL